MRIADSIRQGSVTLFHTGHSLTQITTEIPPPAPHQLPPQWQESQLAYTALIKQ